MKHLFVKLLVLSSLLALVINQGVGHAVVSTITSPYSWDPGLYATTSSFIDDIYGDDYSETHAWGRRATRGAWGTGPVNYQAGSTTTDRMYAGPIIFYGISYEKNFVDVDMTGSYCPYGYCTFGQGTGYKGLVQLWNDPENYIAFGVIKDPGVSPYGITLMIEGAAYGKPIGGYWKPAQLAGNKFNFLLEWDESGVTLDLGSYGSGPGGYPAEMRYDIDFLGKYPIKLDAPSVSFLGAARDTGDIVDVRFDVTHGRVGREY